jgi:hypothetical protein
MYLSLAVLLGSMLYGFVKRRLLGHVPPAPVAPAQGGDVADKGPREPEPQPRGAAVGPASAAIDKSREDAGTGGAGVRRRRQHVPVAYEDGPVSQQ